MTATFTPDHCAAIHGTICPLKPAPHDDEYRRAAKRLYLSGRLNDGDANIDDLATLPAAVVELVGELEEVSA